MPYIASIREYGNARNDSAEFTRSRDAWIWLGLMRRTHEDEVEPYPAWDDPYSGTVDELDALAVAGNDRTGLVLGLTPGNDGSPDQGITYMVTYTQREHE